MRSPLLASLAIFAILLFILNAPTAAHAQASVWFPSQGALKPVSASWGLLVPGLATSTTGCLGIAANGWIFPSGAACGSASVSSAIGTSTVPTIGQLAYWTTNTATPALLGKVATTSLTATSPLSLSSAISVIGASASALSLDTSGTWTGNAGTATALAADPSDCSSGSFTIGINTSGAAQGCTDAWTEAENTAAAYTPQTRTITIAGTANQITSSAGAQDLSANRTWTLSLPSLVVFPGQASTTLFSVSNGAATTTISSSATSTFAAGIDFTRFNLSATSTGSQGINLTGGCFAITGTCIGSGASLTAANTWTQLQTFQAGLISQASSTFTSNIFLGGSVTFNPFTSLAAMYVNGSGVVSFAPTTANSVLWANSGIPSFTSTPILTAASTTRLSVFDTLYIGGAATSTIQGTTSGTSTIQGFLTVSGTNSTSTFSGALTASFLNLTGTAATSTLAGGINFSRFHMTATSTGTFGVNLTGGCFAINGTCLAAVGGSASTTLLVNNNWWTGTNRFTNASTSRLTATSSVWFTGLANSVLAVNSVGLVAGTSTPTAAVFHSTSTTASNKFPYASSTSWGVTGTAFFANSSSHSSTAWAFGTSTPWGALSIVSTTNPGFVVATSTGAQPTFMVNSSGGIILSASQPATSTTITLDWSATPRQVEYRIGTAATSIKLINATTSLQWGSTKIVYVCNAAGTAGALTWGGVRWIGTAPTQTTTADVCDVYSFNVTRATSSSAFIVAGTAGTGLR